MAFVARVVLAGGGEPADARWLGAAAAAGAANTGLSPSSNWARGSLSFNNPDGIGGSLPSVFGTPDAATNPPPTASTLQPRESVNARPLDRRWGSRIRSLGPGAPAPRLPGSRGSAPSCACAGTVHYANGAGSSPSSEPGAPPACSCSRMGASYAASGRREVQEVARGRGAGAAPPPAGARVKPCPGPAALACLRGCPWAHWHLLVCGAAGPHAPLPHSQTEIAPPGGGPQRLPLAGSPKETSARSQDGLRTPPPGPEPAKPRSPWEARLQSPLTWRATCQARSSREAYGHLHRGPYPFSWAVTVILPVRGLPRSSRVSPRWRGEWSP